jgi:hypothetical protein
MRTQNIYFRVGPSLGIAFNRKVGSSAIAKALYDADPALHTRIAFPKDGRGADRPGWQGIVPKVDSPTTVLLLVREPVARFVSAMQQIGRMDVDAVLDAIAGGDWVNPHLLPQHQLAINTTKLFKFPEHLEELAAEAGLAWPLPTINEARGVKPILTSEQEARIRALYAEDIALYESITEAGQELVPVQPFAPALPDYRELRRVAYAAEGADAEALTVALWEDVEEGRPAERIRIQAIRTAIKARYPKP